MSASRDFWLSSGHHLLDRDARGWLLVTDEFLKAYLARPALVPPKDACAAECELHRSLLRDPRRSVAASRIAAIADADARQNWQMMISWREYLVKHRNLEAAYLEIVRRNIRFPHVLTGQLVHAILRNALDECDDVFTLRAAEMFFRPQKLVVGEGSVIVADEEVESSLDRQPRSPLVELLKLPATLDIDLLDETTAASYWQRSDRFDMALDLTAGRRGLAALGDVVTRWLSHLLEIDVAIEALTELRDARLSWYVGLSAEATRIGDTLWNGGELSDAMRAQLVGLFRLTFRDPTAMIERVKGEPLYLLMKPQNLLTGLPIREQEAVN